MFNSSYDKIGLNFKFEGAFISELKNILGPPAVTYYNGNSTTYYHDHSQRCLDGRVVCLAICYLNKGECNLNQSKDDSFLERVAKNNS